jgi:uncharacterized membrane protein
MMQQLTDLGLVLILFGAILIVLGFVMLVRTGGEEGQERKSLAVFLIGPIPVIVKGGIKIALIALAITILIILLVLSVLGA